MNLRGWRPWVPGSRRASPGPGAAGRDRAAPPQPRRIPALVPLLLAAAWCAGAIPPVSAGAPPEPRREEPFRVRPFRPGAGERWVGNGIAYGPHRDGQRPGGPAPTVAQLREDLRLLARRWQLVRMYGAAESPAGDVLRIIRDEGLDLKLMLGVWIAVEERRDEDGRVVERFPEAARENRREVEAAIRLAGAYPDLVAAVCVGNETQVFWSGHRSPPDILVRHVREVRAGTRVPVTVADDFNFWNKPESREVAREVDFIVTHYHPLWNGVLLPDALGETRRVYASIRTAHPDRTVVLGETGWATRRHAEGEQARLMKGESSEAAQAAYFREVTAWARANRVPLFYFEAFDENWKGGPHPDEVEKHWGLYRADRTPKPAVAGTSP